MQRKEVPPERWASFLDEFTRRHHGGPVLVEIAEPRRVGDESAGAGRATRRVAVDAPLSSIALEGEPSEAELVIDVGRGAERIEHRAGRPVQVRLVQEDDGAARGIEVDTSGGETAFVGFRAAVQPEVLDGISEAEWQWCV